MGFNVNGCYLELKYTIWCLNRYMECIVICEVLSDQDNSICAFRKNAEGDSVDPFKNILRANVA